MTSKNAARVYQYLVNIDHGIRAANNWTCSNMFDYERDYIPVFNRCFWKNNAAVDMSRELSLHEYAQIVQQLTDNNAHTVCRAFRYTVERYF